MRLWLIAPFFLLACAGNTAVPSETRLTVVFLGDSLTAGLGLPLEQAFPSLIEARLKAGELIVAIGDSITAGGGYLRDIDAVLAQQYPELKATKVVNAGVSGDTTAGGLVRLDWIYEQKVDVLVVALGANDGLRGIPVEQTEKNLRAILQRARKEGSRVLLTGLRLPDNFGTRAQARFAAIYPRLASEFRVPLVPFLLEGVAMEPGLNQADGIHPNAKGARRVADHIWEKLGPMLSSPR